MVIAFIVAIGALLFYVLSLFFGNPLQHQPQNLPVETRDLDLVETSSQPSESRNNSVFLRGGDVYAPVYGLGDVGGDSTIQVNLSDYTSAQKELMLAGDRPEVLKSTAANQTLKRLQALGLGDDAFTTLLIQSETESLWKAEQAGLEVLVEKKRYDEALELLEDLMRRTDARNLITQSELYERAADIAVLKGDLSAYRLYSEKFFSLQGELLATMKSSRMMSFHQAREKVAQMEKQLEYSKGGTVFQFLSAISQNGISPVDIAAGLKANVSMNSNQGDVPLTQEEVNQSGKMVEELFTRFRH